ncbi:MAG TPA: 30S ribosomal protein S16 [Candidatus Atribacteria bacterium]|nr:30S ribosomal protein S16 [Candidatus Atribacteria bacterium]HPU08348.1 30S ribosomal protein S16 [Candidatus Atribacteria bacterium]HPZ81485.1 30S ribosomal protein S16 [Candidatus Atribacteria bacterium]HQE24533.1 30S ribosomal protein S16 [Candidatus Atribacteria bacterium]
MAVKLRLTRVGRKHLPYYRIVAIDSRKARDGKPIEILGNYSPIADPPVWSLREERIEYWISQGAEVSSKVKAILKKAKVQEQ